MSKELPMTKKNNRGIAEGVKIVGIDGEPPIYDDTQVWRRWGMHDIFLGHEGYRKYIPKVNDFVEDIDSLETYRVISIDPTTLIPNLVRVVKKINIDEMEKDEGRFFAGGNLVSPCARQIFYDNSVARPTLKIPSQFHIQGTSPHYAIAYKGSVATKNGIPVSVRYDQNFTAIGNEIPLIPVKQRDPNNNTQWIIPDFYCSHELEEGELITILIYDDRGGLTSRTNWIVEYSSLLRDISDADKFISAISLESVYIDTSDESNMLIPEQVLKNSINIVGKVHYTDGSIISYPVDGNKFELIYLDRAADSVASTKGVLVLKYYLDDNERSVHVINNNNRHFITRSFNYTIVERDGAHSVKLYPVPIWVNEQVGWQLDWYMFTLERNQYFDVTNSVYITSNSPVKKFNGRLFGPIQNLNVAIDLSSINNTFGRYIHPQTVDIRLLGSGTDEGEDRYLLGFEANQNPLYGYNVICRVKIVSAGHYKINISNGHTVLEEWLEAIYYNTRPQYKTKREPCAPKPNMFKILVNGTETEFPIRFWKEDNVIRVENIKPTDTIKVLFFSRTNNNDLYYSIAPMPVRMAK